MVRHSVMLKSLCSSFVCLIMLRIYLTGPSMNGCWHAFRPVM